MSFRLQPILDDGRCGDHCPQVIAAEGQIVNSTPQDFLEFLRDNIEDRNLRTVVFINSQGGFVVASMELGQMFRRIGAATVVARVGASSGRSHFLQGQCLSACVYAFMGGKKRVAPRGSALGIHRMFANQVREHFFAESEVIRRYDNGAMATTLMNYSARMGVSRDIIRAAEHISSATLHIVTAQEMARWNLAHREF
jgi:hypothetical protein